MTYSDAKDILSNEKNAKIYLEKLSRKIEISIPFTKKGTILLKGKELWNFIADNWCDDGLYIIREMFKSSQKYNNGKNATKLLEEKTKDFKEIFGEVKWGFSQNDCENFLQRLNNNNKNLTDVEKDKIASESIIKNRRKQELNTLRNDYIEYLIFEKNTNVIPTLSHKYGVDFFKIENNIFEKWDQKVSKSPTEQFKKNYGENWKEIAIKHPEEVAKYLYQHQDSGRFGADNRIFVVYLSEDVNNDNIKNTIMNFNNPYEINFEYKHDKDNIKTYTVNCFVILLY